LPQKESRIDEGDVENRKNRISFDTWGQRNVRDRPLEKCSENMILGFYKYPEGNLGIPTGSSKNRDIPFWRWAGTTEGARNDRRGYKLTTVSSTLGVFEVGMSDCGRS
jgi:hypothetical protein